MSAPAPRLQLPEVTLVCVDTGVPQASLAALLHCMREIDFGDVLLFTDPMRVPDAPREVHLRGLQVRDAQSRSEFMLEDLAGHVFTSHALVIQHDAFIGHAAQWDPDFLLYDYIGAPMRGLPANQAVGHGAFSLRSRRLLVALRMAAIHDQAPDDQVICQQHRAHLEQVHDIRYAPLDVAQRFSQAHPASHPSTFGFQGLQHLPRVLAPEALQALVAKLPDSVLQGTGGVGLCTALIEDGQFDTAAAVIAARSREHARDPRTLRLRLQLTMARWSHRRQSGFHA